MTLNFKEVFIKYKVSNGPFQYEETRESMDLFSSRCVRLHSEIRSTTWHSSYVVSWRNIQSLSTLLTSSIIFTAKEVNFSYNFSETWSTSTVNLSNFFIKLSMMINIFKGFGWWIKKLSFVWCFTSVLWIITPSSTSHSESL